MYDIIITPANKLRLCDTGGKYMLTVPMQYFNGTLTANVTSACSSFNDAYNQAKKLRETENHLPDAKLYFIHNDIENTRYDLDDDNVLVMLYLILSDHE
jgi:hypothetical protein